MPLPPPRHHMKDDIVRAVEAELLNSGVFRLALKNRDNAAVSAWGLCRHQPKTTSFPRVNSFCNIRLLEIPTIHPSLCHPAKCQSQTPVSAVLDVERAKPDHYIYIMSDPPSLLGMPLRRDAHPLPPEIFYLSSSICLPSLYSVRPSSCLGPAVPAV